MTGIIVLEGADCTGKSTLAKALVDKFNGVYVHATWSEELARVMWDYHLGIVINAVEQSKSKLVVIDRLWLSEAVYGHVYRCGSSIPHEGRMLDRILMAHGALNIVCLHQTPELGVAAISASAKKRDEMWEGEGKIKTFRLCEYFHEYVYGGRTADKSNYADVYAAGMGALVARSDTVRYCIADHGSKSGMEFFVGVVEARLNELKRRAYRFRSFGTNVVGSPAASHLVCGDALNPKDPNTRWPFCEYGHASLWLAESMHKADVDELRVAFTNVNDDGGAVARALSAADKTLNVVCLGHKAAVTLSKNGITNFKQIPHPQWDRRFNRNGVKSYAEALAEVLPTT